MKLIIVSLLALVLINGAAFAAVDAAQLKALKAKQWIVPEMGLKMAHIPAGRFTSLVQKLISTASWVSTWSSQRDGSMRRSLMLAVVLCECIRPVP